MKRSVLCCALCALLLSGCTEDRTTAVAERPDDAPQRRLAAVTWDTVFEVGGPEDDTVLESAVRIAADPHGVYVVDAYAGRIHRFSPDGQRRWVFGRQGSGPNELLSPRDIDVDSAGSAWVLDPQNLRILVVDTAGRARTRILLDRVGQMFDVFAPVSTSSAVIVALDADSPLVRVDSTGAVLERHPFPWAGYAQLDPLASQIVTRADARSGRWVAAFVMGDGLFGFEGTHSLGYHAWFTEPVPFPSVRRETSQSEDRAGIIGRPVFGAHAAGISDSVVYLLFGGRTPAGYRVVDCFGLEDGEYRGSFLLPRVAHDIAVVGDVVYGTYNAPFPAIAGWRPAGGAPLPCR